MTTTLPGAPPRPRPAEPAPRPPARRPRATRTPGNLRLTITAAVASALGALALVPLFMDGGWYLPSLAGIAAVAVAGGLCRALRVPLVLHPLLQGLALSMLLVAVYAHDTATGGLLPNPTALGSLRATTQVGMDDLYRFAPPVPTTASIVAVTVLGVGLAALLVDVLVVALRAPALAGLPLLAMYVVTAAVLRNAPWWAFIPGAIGWLLLLTADSREGLASWGAVLDRVRRPGGPVDADDPAAAAGPSTRPAHATVASTRAPALGPAAWRVGLVALTVAVVLPLLLPSLTESVFRRGPGGGPGDGSADSAVAGTVRINPFVSLKRDYFDVPDRIVMAYTTDDPSPEYLRTVVLNRFTGDTWEPDAFEVRNDREVNGGLPPQVDFLSNQDSMPVRSYSVRIRGLDGRYLPMPYPTTAVTIGSGWYYDPATRVVFSDGSSIDGARYNLTAVDVDTTPARLRAAPPLTSPALGGSLDTANIPPAVTTLARQVVGDAPTAYDQAVRLQDWFRTEFSYSTSVRSGNDASYLEQFLRDRVGYCEQFAATMALMARTLGIPARVAVGFTQGTLEDGQWRVSLRDAHAWPELWFAGTGWVRFEPTPAGAANVTVPTYAEPAAAPSGGATATPGVAAPGGSGLRASRIRDREAERDAATTEILDVGGTGDTAATPDDAWRRPLLLGLLAAALLVAALPWTVRQWRRRRRLAADDTAALVEGAWAELRDTCRDLGLPWSDADTPRRRGAEVARVGGLSDEPAAALVRLVAATETARYARTGTPGPGRRSIRADVAAVRAGLFASASGRTRWRARWWPASARPWHDASPAPA